MATISRRGERQWQAKIRRKGVAAANTFETKARAEAWARQIEADIDAGRFQPGRIEAERTTLKEALERYLSEKVPLKKGVKQTTGLVRYWLGTSLAARSLASIRASEIAAWRDQFLKQRSPQTVVHYLNLLSNVFTVAGSEWGMESLANPVGKVKKPTLPRGRDRRLAPDEEAVLLAACDASKSKWLGTMVRLALETAMRQGEFVGLAWDDVNLDRRTIFLRETKNGSSRTVPLSSRAVEVLRSWQATTGGKGKLFDIEVGRAVSHAFLAVCRKAKLPDLHFHDLRHEATSRFFEKTSLRDMQIAMITGHRSMEMLKRYAHIRAEELAKELG